MADPIRKAAPAQPAQRRGAGVRSDFFGGASIDAADLILSPSFGKRLKQVASLGFGAVVRRRDPKPQR